MKKTFNIVVKLKSPMCIATGSSTGSLVDKYFVKDRSGKPYIPASTIKGIMRQNFMSLIDEEHCDDMKCMCPVCKVFGSPGYNPSKLYIDDLLLDDDVANIGSRTVRHSTSVDRYRKVAKDNSLTSMEVYEGGTFKGTMDLYLDESTEKYEELILISLKIIESIGAGKSRGYGWVHVDVKEGDEW
ncbi:RAMP superfamily CRISPR-associated protein [Thermoanaerobacterium thermosaccharolyticum]|uniref:RAMP superfamily CRISPR-associated protein n=1 Tax=Thermoanaerobacterium thermosaccharolyticum TaxID=1517 RepID=UPI0017857486|nr:RAMP superfamily CRISPR-associated protein [Thermoanaerobacterium thermosaccharolyticum]MBE0069099.1 RAMP superfamily protein [Thermoanaerobacterium thermosaccharolyticum]MBE0228922.1 RAMP superfamily protein [Thermoanaerobacterium thermosaccharolyticum]